MRVHIVRKGTVVRLSFSGCDAIGLTPGVRSVLELIQLARIFEIYDDVETAVRS